MDRRLSTSSDASDDSAHNSTSALVLVHDDDDSAPATPFDFSSDDEDDDPFEIDRSYTQALDPSTVFLYLLSPCWKLGAILLPHTGLPLKFIVPALLLFALLSIFSRQLWYNLARYFCKVDFHEVMLDVLAKGREKERTREILRGSIKGMTIVLRLLLAWIYLRECVHLLAHLLPEWGPASVPVLTAFLSLLILAFSLSQSLASKRVIYVTWFSIVTYLFWFGCTAYAYAKGLLQANPTSIRLGTFWQGITIAAFTYTSSSTLLLYASLKAGTSHITTAKTPRAHSFKILSIISVSIAVSLTLPLTFFALSPNTPVAQDNTLPRLGDAIMALQGLTLYFGIPSLLATTPSIPMPARIRRSATISKTLFVAIVGLLSLVPTAVSSVLSDILLICALVGMYFVPALTHVATHFLRRPLSIIMPTTPNPFTPAVDDFDPPSSANDPLLQRKERALQKRQLRRRIVWDLGVWLVLLPLSGSGFIWAIGKLLGKW